MNNKDAFIIYRRLPKEIHILFLGKIVNSLGFFVFPFLAIFLTSNLGMAENRVGLILMITAAAYIPGALIGGKLSDNYGRKKTLVLFQTLAALCLVPCAFSENPKVIVSLLVLTSIFNGASQPTYNAMCADLTSPGNRKEAYSLLYLGNNIGVAAGPLIAGFLYNSHIEMIFLGDALTTLMSVGLIIAFVGESLPDQSKIMDGRKIDSDERSEEGHLLQVLFRRPVLLIFAIISVFYSLVYSQMEFALPLQTKAIFGLDGPKVFGSLMTVNALTVIFATVIIVDLTRRIKPILNIVISGLFFAVGFGMIYYVQSHLFLVISTFIWTLGEILSATNLNVYIANHTPMSHRGRFGSIVLIISGAGHAIGPAYMGQFIVNNSLQAVWPLTFWIAVGASCLMLGLYISEEKRIKKLNATWREIKKIDKEG